MEIYLLRHGETAWNRVRRYQGRRDVPLSPEGEAAILRADFNPERVYVSPLSRAVKTAERMFPEAELVPMPELVEMNFGVFEGRNADEMEHDPAYRAWVDSGCEDRCPGGETRREFGDRVCGAFDRLVEAAAEQGTESPLVIVSHGGVQMAVMERTALPERAYYDWYIANGSGYVLDWDPVLWKERRRLRLNREVRYIRPDTVPPSDGEDGKRYFPTRNR